MKVTDLKNMILTTFGRNESGHMIWHPSFYDCDSVLGLANNGELRYDAGVDMDADAFNSRTSALWTKLRKNFPQQIKDRYVELRRTRNINGVTHPPIFSVDNVMKYLDDELMGKIGQRYYNDDAERKYINDEGSTWLIACNGTREDFTRRWLQERFIYLDSVYENGDFNQKTMVLRTNVLGNINLQLKSYSPMWVRVNYTSSQSKKIYISKNRFYDFEVNMTNDLENDFTIYGANNLMYVNNMESLNVSHISISGAEKLIEVNCSESEHIKGLELGQNKYLQRVICNDCKRLGEEERDRHLNLSGCQNLKEVNCKNTKIATLSLPEEGGVLETLDCSNSGLTSFVMKGQEYLEELDLASCSKLSSLTVENCDGLQKIDMPNTILSSCIIRGCENLEDINLSNTKNLTLLDLQGCPNLKKLNLSGVLSTTLKDLDLSASLKLENLNISSTPYIECITFGQYRDENQNLVNFNALKVLDCGGSGVKAIRYGKLNAIPENMDLAGLNLTSMNFRTCPNIKEIRNINLEGSGISPFRDCRSLTTLHGKIKLKGSMDGAFYNCYSLRNIHNTLNLDLSEVTSTSGTFENCDAFGWSEVSFIMSKLSSAWKNGHATFYLCNGISGAIPSNLFSTCKSVTTLTHFFSGCNNITGSVPETLFSGLTALQTTAYMFSGASKLSGGVNKKLFESAGNSLKNVSYMFNGTKLSELPNYDLFENNLNLESVAGIFKNCSEMLGEITRGFFTGLTKLTSASEMFRDCPLVFGDIPRDMFRNTPDGVVSNLKTIDFLLRGTGMTGQIPAYVSDSSKGLLDNLPNLTNISYLLPTGVSGNIPPNMLKFNTQIANIEGLFNGCSGLTGDIPANLFKTLSKLSNAKSCFAGCSGLFSEIPKGLFENNEYLTNVSNLFNGCVGLRGQIPERISEWVEVPDENNPDSVKLVEVVHEYGLFDKCKSLTYADNLFRGCSTLNSTIPETLFISGGNITDLNSIFAGCLLLHGKIPDKLFENCTNLLTLNSAFSDCDAVGKHPLEVTEDDPYAFSPDLFKNCRKLVSISGLFYHCGNIRGSLHRNTFRMNPNLTSVNGMFQYCGNIQGELSGDLFAGNKEITNTANAFQSTSITTVGSSFLATNPKLKNITSMFEGCSRTTGTAPKLWLTPATETIRCFNGCNFSDQESIPATYK